MAITNMLRKIIYSDGVNTLPSKIMVVLFALMVSNIPGLLMVSIFSYYIFSDYKVYVVKFNL